MLQSPEKLILDYYTYPPVGCDDWRYAFQTARIRAIETQMLSHAMLVDMANSETFEQAADLLLSTEYALPAGGSGLAEMEAVLTTRRSAVRELFEELMIDKSIVMLFRSRSDFANLKLALRRVLTDKPLGQDYCGDGNVAPELFEEVLVEENYELFPDYMTEAAERASLAYYQDKDIRRIDYAIDAAQAGYNLKRARQLKSVFLSGLFRIQIDLTNIRTMLRLKFTESQQRKVFIEGGYLGMERLMHGLDTDFEAVASLFFVTPHHHIVQTGSGYLASDKSFLKLEQQCEEYLTGFLKTTTQITSGHQPIVAYLLMKENEIRMVRLILTAKKNSLDTKLVLDRIA